MPSPEILIREIGAIAHQQLGGVQRAAILGVTSRGFFLKLESGWVIFISPETFRGPLTLNLVGDATGLMRLENGQPAMITSGSIFFPKSGLVINYAQSREWEASAPAEASLPRAQRQERLIQVCRLALAQRQGSQLSALLPVLLGIESAPSSLENSPLPLLRHLQQSLGERQAAAIVAGMDALLGLGSGLTPAGDDLAAGLLLSLVRWGDLLAPGLDGRALGREVMRLAYRKTTTLAANLIECAAQGQANERLLISLDGMVTGQTDPVTCAAYLANWGHTSGLDALTGMALALIA
jgi:hypothetical protein